MVALALQGTKQSRGRTASTASGKASAGRNDGVPAHLLEEHGATTVIARQVSQYHRHLYAYVHIDVCLLKEGSRRHRQQGHHPFSERILGKRRLCRKHAAPVRLGGKDALQGL